MIFGGLVIEEHGPNVVLMTFDGARGMPHCVFTRREIGSLISLLQPLAQKAIQQPATKLEPEVFDDLLG